jgi:hypothetical protein
LRQEQFSAPEFQRWILGWLDEPAHVLPRRRPVNGIDRVLKMCPAPSRVDGNILLPPRACCTKAVQSNWRKMTVSGRK